MANSVQRYQLLSKDPIGAGGFGRVFLGQDTQTQSPVALKTVPFKKYAPAEVEIHKSISCEGFNHVVHYRSDFTVSSKDLHCVVMDFVNGEDVYQKYIATRKKLPPSEMKSFVFQALEFCSALQQKGIVYRDFKPDNMIWLPEARQLKMIDLGGAIQEKEGRYPRTGPGNCYAPPDYVLGKPCTTAFDLFSLGVTIYVLFCRAYPFPVDPKLKDRPSYEQELQMIVERLGLPSAEYLRDCRDAGRYFDEKGELKLNQEIPKFEFWQEEFLGGLEDHNVPEEEKEQWLELLYRLLSYDNRGTPEEHLQNPLFQSEIPFHIVYNPAKKCTLLMHRMRFLPGPANSVKSSDFVKPDIFVDFNEFKGNCFHILKNQGDQYLIVLEKDNVVSKGIIQLWPGINVDITELQNELEPQKEIPVEAVRRTLRWDDEKEPPLKKCRSAPGEL